MSEFYSYVTEDKDRWDLIAYKFYANPNKYEEIIKANPTIKANPVLTAGIKLKIPVLQEEQTIKFEVAPWRK